jgi:hypothetical protein
VQEKAKDRKKETWRAALGDRPATAAAGGPRRRRPRTRRLGMPAIGMESEFNVVLDGTEIDPRKYWGRPTAFIDRPLLVRERSSYQLPTGGAVYFDRGVIEVVTPVIELAPGCTARVVRNLWEGIGFVRGQLTRWGAESGHDVRLVAYSAHYNVSFELPRRARSRDRNAGALALLLAHILPFPLALVAANRRSTGVGVRPRGDRVEITVDFTPDPGLMIAAAALVAGVVREVMSWPSYALSVLDRRSLPTIAGVVPGPHTTRKGWLTKDHHYVQSPYRCDVDAPIWRTRDGRTLSLRRVAREVAWPFRRSIRRWSDPFSFRLLFAVLDGRARSLLELPDRPAAYEDVGRSCAWGRVLPALVQTRFAPGATPLAAAPPARPVPASSGKGAHVPAPAPRPPAPAAAPAQRLRAPRVARLAPRAAPSAATVTASGLRGTRPPVLEQPSPRERRMPKGVAAERGGRTKAPVAGERRAGDRRRRPRPVPFPDRRLTRSAYEKVFLKLVSGQRLRIGRYTYTPVGMKGWFQAVFRRDQDGTERVLSIDDLRKRMDSWQA